MIRNIIAILPIILLSTTLFAQQEKGKKAITDTINEYKRADTLTINQLNGVRITIVGFGTVWLPYTETIDGYTVVRNMEGIYEYARQTKNGDLVPANMIAHNPEEREDKETRFLKGQKKHLRYQSQKLDQLINRKKKMFYRDY